MNGIEITENVVDETTEEYDWTQCANVDDILGTEAPEDNEEALEDDVNPFDEEEEPEEE